MTFSLVLWEKSLVALFLRDGEIGFRVTHARQLAFGLKVTHLYLEHRFLLLDIQLNY